MSITPTKRWSGVAYVSGPRIPVQDLERVDPDLPLCAHPARLRTALERSIVIHLAGPAAEQLRPDQPVLQRLAPERLDDLVALATAEHALTTDDRMLLARGDSEESEERWHDQQKAADEARALAGIRANALLTFLRNETELFVRTREFRRLLDPLARALVERTDIGAREVRRILKEAQ